jgi:hypothetical protein
VGSCQSYARSRVAAPKPRATIDCSSPLAAKPKTTSPASIASTFRGGDFRLRATAYPKKEGAPVTKPLPGTPATGPSRTDLAPCAPVQGAPGPGSPLLSQGLAAQVAVSPEKRFVDAQARRSICRVALHPATVMPWSSPWQFHQGFGDSAPYRTLALSLQPRHRTYQSLDSQGTAGGGPHFHPADLLTASPSLRTQLHDYELEPLCHEQVHLPCNIRVQLQEGLGAAYKQAVIRLVKVLLAHPSATLA